MNRYQKLLSALYAEKKRRYGQSWSCVGRANQQIPAGNWRIWLIMAGRGFGKTRTGAETVRQWVRQGYKRIALVGHSMDDVRHVMVEGASGLMSIIPSYEGVVYEPSNHRVRWPCGAQALCYSAGAYHQLRGPQFDAAWIDELAKFDDVQKVWDQLMFGMRLGPKPRIVITTTPRPIPLMKGLLQRPDVVITRGSTLDNQNNLSKEYVDMIVNQYGKTRLGAQEIEGQIVEERGSGLWTSAMIQRCHNEPPLQRVVVAIDPAVTCHDKSDETGIVVAGIDQDQRGYVLADLSARLSASDWVHAAAKGYHHYGADRIVAEVNNGGDMVKHLLHTLYPNVPYKGVYAMRNKKARAEPIAALYEQGRVMHCGYFHDLEQQMILTDQYRSPDRMDALVWALTELFFDKCIPAPRIVVV
jgi:phage terminase large subunit-like protein